MPRHPSPDSHPAWVQVDLDAISSNVRAVSAYVGSNVEVMAVVKANGYGHGLEESAKAAVAGGAACLGVANPVEGVRLRQSGITSPIVILGATLPSAAAKIVEAELSATVTSLPSLHALQTEAARLGRRAGVHLKLETGMGRVGAYLEEIVELAKACSAAPDLDIEGIATHVGWEIGRQSEAMKDQIQTFAQERDVILSHLKEAPRWTHAANSLVTTSEPEGRFNLVRAGLLTYGISPSPEQPESHPLLQSLKPALAIHARITQIRVLRAGQPVSYGGTTIIDRDTTAAIIPVGYGDGYPRFPQGGGDVLIAGRRCPILGTVCMDQMVVDVTGCEAEPGTRVTLLGASEEHSISAPDLAAASGRISYEMVTGLVARLPYVYTP